MPFIYKTIEKSRIKYSKAYNTKIFSFLHRSNYIIFSQNNATNLYVEISKTWLLGLKKLFSIRYSNTSITKNVEIRNQDNYLFYFIRKNKIFNKGRFSRNRQLYRTGVYWSLWVNILAVYGLFFLFYRFSFNFGYLWWFFGFFFLSFIFSRAVQHKFYSINVIKNELTLFVNWFSILFDNCKNFFKNYLFVKIDSLIKFNNLVNFIEKQDFFLYKNFKYLQLKLEELFLVKNLEAIIDVELKRDEWFYTYVDKVSNYVKYNINLPFERKLFDQRVKKIENFLGFFLFSPYYGRKKKKK